MNCFTGLILSMLFLSLSSQYGNIAAEVYLSPSVESTGLLPSALGPFGQQLLNPAVTAAAEADLKPLGPSYPMPKLFRPISSLRGLVPRPNGPTESVPLPYGPYGSNAFPIPFGPAVASYAPLTSLEAMFAAELYDQKEPIVPAVVPEHKYLVPYSSFSSAALADPSRMVKAKPFGPPGQIVSEPKYFGSYSSLKSAASATPLPQAPRAVLPLTSEKSSQVVYPFEPLLTVEAKPFGKLGPIVQAVVRAPEYLEPYSSLSSAALETPELAVPRTVRPVENRQLTPVFFPFAPQLPVETNPLEPLETVLPAVVSAPEYLEPQSSSSSAALGAPPVAVPRAVLPAASRQLAPVFSPFATQLPVEPKPIGPPGPVVPAVASAPEYLDAYSSLSSAPLGAPSLAVPKAVLPVASRQLSPVSSPFAPQLPVEAKPFGPPGPFVQAPEYLDLYSSLSSAASGAPLYAVPRSVLPATSRQLAPVFSFFAPKLRVEAKPFGPPRPMVPTVVSSPEYLKTYSSLSSAALGAPSLSVPSVEQLTASKQFAPVFSSFGPQLPAEAKPFGPPGPFVKAPEYLDLYTSLSSAPRAVLPVANRQFAPDVSPFAPLFV